MMRAQILLFALCGQMGRKGAGYDTLPFLIIDGTMSVPSANRLRPPRFAPGNAAYAAVIRGAEVKGLTTEMATFELARRPD